MLLKRKSYNLESRMKSKFKKKKFKLNLKLKKSYRNKTITTKKILKVIRRLNKQMFKMNQSLSIGKNRQTKKH